VTNAHNTVNKSKVPSRLANFTQLFPYVTKFQPLLCATALGV